MKRFKKLLVAYDNDDTDRGTLARAVMLARENGGRLTLVHSIPPLPWYVRATWGGQGELAEMMLRDAEKRLNQVIASLEADDVEVNAKVLQGQPGVALIREVLHDGHDLVIKTAAGPEESGSHLIGAVDMRLLRKCPCPVWVCKPEPMASIRRVLAAVDPESGDGAHQELNRTVLELAASLAEMEDAELHVLHAWSLFGESFLSHRMSQEEIDDWLRGAHDEAAAALDQLVEPYNDQLGKGRVHLIKGPPSMVIHRYIKDHSVNVLVMGTVARTGVTGMLMGNTAESILRSINCSVLAIKPSGFVTPVRVEEP